MTAASCILIPQWAFAVVGVVSAALAGYLWAKGDMSLFYDDMFTFFGAIGVGTTTVGVYPYMETISGFLFAFVNVYYQFFGFIPCFAVVP